MDDRNACSIIWNEGFRRVNSMSCHSVEAYYHTLKKIFIELIIYSKVLKQQQSKVHMSYESTVHYHRAQSQYYKRRQ